ncbi:HAD family hydrolase [Desulfopila aestuarii]|uniref:phosphoglycolate phosphatase n=1 Tax=Desulfopila aestuarii DSM 18488 TaxID=1121416 RepID=A0A1M7Y104_9BACT|nr:HAD family hydrolase [Desulfopila aestuarii]SHO45382.1 phosphoglycolate phosphatase [Desulfopila aestuarii DSM 18488]
MHKKTVIFDLDGTLLDTLEDLAYAGNAVLAECGFPQHPVDKYKYFVGDGMRVLMERIAPSTCTPEKIDQCCTIFNRIYGECWHRRTTLYPGIENMLKRLREKGVRLAILSNKPHQFTTVCVDRFFPGQRFDLVFGQRENVKKKPDPAGAFEIAAKLDVQPADCVYVGDTAVDMQTGKSAGMFTIGVLWGFRTFDELRENNADLIVDHPMEIVDHVISAG